MHFVYKITGPDRIYIGKTGDVKKRWGFHQWNSRRGKIRSHLYAAMKKYGLECFFIDVIATSRTHEDALACEVAIIAAEKVHGTLLYNLTAGGEGVAGPKSAETRAKMSAAHRGKKLSAEHCAKMSAAQRGKTLSAETRAKMSVAKQGKPRAAEAIAKTAEGNRGQKRSAETLAKMREARKVRWAAERCAKISAVQKVRWA